MPAGSIDAFLRAFSGSLASSWAGPSVAALAARSIPDELAGTRWELLTGDLRYVWAEWWVATFGDPVQLADSDYPTLYAHARTAVASRFPGEPATEINGAARQVARLLLDIVRRQHRQRLRLTELDRRELVLEAGDPPRCWICGWPFPSYEVDRFLGTIDVEPLTLPLYVDVVLPRGRVVQDLAINADHVLPVAAGGGHRDNLRLACGWCNRAKGASLTVYDAPLAASVVNHPRVGRLTVPHPVWVVRALATVGRCESPDGCRRTTRTDALTIAPRWIDGALSPANLTVTCSEHDPWKSVRWVPRDAGR